MDRTQIQNTGLPAACAETCFVPYNVLTLWGRHATMVTQQDCWTHSDIYMYGSLTLTTQRWTPWLTEEAEGIRPEHVREKNNPDKYPQQQVGYVVSPSLSCNSHETCFLKKGFRVRRVVDGGQVASVNRDGQTLTFVVRGNLKPLSLECLSYFYGKKNNMDKKGGDRNC